MKYLVIGDAILDHYVFGTISRRSPENPVVPVLDIESEESRLGGCMNVAANLKSLSKDIVHVSSIMSTLCNKMLEAREIKCVYSCNLENLEGIKKTRIFNLKTGDQIVRLDNIKRFDDDLIEEYQFLLNYANFKDYDCIVVSDYKKGTINEKVIQKLINFDGPVFVDTKNSDISIWNKVENCIIKMNWDEWKKTEGTTKHEVVITDGDYGAFLRRSNGKQLHYPAEKVECLDVTGAGDVFIAGLVVEYMRSFLLGRAVQFANTVAAKSVTMFGTVEIYL